MRGQSFPRNMDLEKRFGGKDVNPWGIDGNTVLMLHGDDLTDSSFNPKVITNNGVTVSTAQSKFGGKSLYFNGSSYLSLADSDDWNFGSGDFTIDMWLFLSSTAYYPIIAQSDTGWGQSSIWIVHAATTNILAQTSSTGSGTMVDTSTTFPFVQNQWGHVAFVRCGNNFYLFIDGNIVSQATSAGTIFNSSRPLTIGTFANLTNYMTGHLDELRISKGVARWTSNFTPPTAPYSI